MDQQQPETKCGAERKKKATETQKEKQNRLTTTTFYENWMFNARLDISKYGNL